jgi:rhamnogalacturonyl hydrolase YesR
MKKIKCIYQRSTLKKVLLFSLLICLILFSYSQQRSLPDLIRLITDHQLPNNPLSQGNYPKGTWQDVEHATLSKTMYWSYPVGVVQLGMQRGYEITHDKKVLKYISDNNNISADAFFWMSWQLSAFGKIHDLADIEKLLRFKITGSGMLDDYGAMGAAILESRLRHKVKLSSNLYQLIDTIGYLITKKQDRLPDGTFWRPDSPDGPTIWADDLYMSIPFLIRWSEYKNDPGSLDDAALQIINYASYLQDNDRVWFHAYFNGSDKNEHSCCKWGRANGWVTVAIAEMLSVLPKDHPKYKKLLNICKKQIDGLVKLQSPSGLWNQVLDHPELSWGTETSCSAQFTYAIARGINKGWLDNSYIPIVKKSLHALIDTSRISANGDILKVSASTSIGSDLNYYNSRPVEVDDQKDRHGSGSMLLMLAEMYRLLNNIK